MRTLLIAAGAALTLAACGGGEDTKTTTVEATSSDANAMAAENMMVDTNASVNGATMNGNMAVDPTTQNLIEQDMNTNAPDTNLANGL
jgi:hypothetical protein